MNNTCKKKKRWKKKKKINKYFFKKKTAQYHKRTYSFYNIQNFNNNKNNIESPFRKSHEINCIPLFIFPVKSTNMLVTLNIFLSMFFVIAVKKSTFI